MITTIYILEPPAEVLCWYCMETCKQNRWENASQALYYCNNHEPLEVMFRCVQHETEPPNWFFNTIRVSYGNIRLDHNFHSGNKCHLETIVNWKRLEKFDREFILSDIKKIHSYLTLYKVWS